MERKQFTFYNSFFDAISRIKKKADRADAYDAICKYALFGTEPELDKMPDSAAIAFVLSKPNLDASKRKAESGRAGGKQKQSASKAEANGKESGSEKEIEKENEIENECYPPNPLAAVMTAYLEKVNPMASQTCLDELKGFVEEMGAECCLRAMDIALDAKKTSWSYIRAILRDKLSAGVKCLADWDELDARREAAKGQSSEDGKQYHPSVEKMMGGKPSREMGEFERNIVRRIMEGKT